jgi:hypothetical protein
VPHVANKYDWDFVLCSIRNDSRGRNLSAAVILNSIPDRNREMINRENSCRCDYTVYPFCGPLEGFA